MQNSVEAIKPGRRAAVYTDVGADEDLELSRRLADPGTRGAAVAELVDAYGARLHARLAQMVGPQDADDLFQNTLIKVMQHAGGFEGKATLYSWCYRVATNEALDFLRKRRRRGGPTDDLDEVATRLTTRAALPPPHLIEAALQEAICGLPPKQRTVFEARYYHETPYAELSAQLGTSVGALKASYHHAVGKVSAHLRLSPLNLHV